MPYEMQFSAPVSMDHVLTAILRVLELNCGSYVGCERCYSDGTVAIKEPNLLSAQSCNGQILCLSGVGKKQGLDAFKRYEVEFNWQHPKNKVLSEGADLYLKSLRIVEELLMGD